jgi:AraC-like DNA-binding protein
MRDAYFFAGREPELHGLITHPDRTPLDRQLRAAACRGMDPDAFHPDEGRPDDLVLARCTGCRARLACLALALRAEYPDVRQGWYGGLGPDDRDSVAAALGLEPPEPPEPPTPHRAAQAARLRAASWTVEAIATELGCSRRTVQRYLRAAA